MPTRGGVAILVGWVAVGTPVVGFIPVAAAAAAAGGIASIFAFQTTENDILLQEKLNVLICIYDQAYF